MGALKKLLIFGSAEIAAAQDWNLPEEMLPHLDRLRALSEKGTVSFTEKFGIGTFGIGTLSQARTAMHRVTDPKGSPR